MTKIAIVIYGPPGSGKGTQAKFLADKLDLIHLDTGRFLRSIIYDPARQKSKIIHRERRINESGALNTPSFVLKEVRRETEKIFKAGWGIIFSGSPRTLYEAEGLVPYLEKLYGRKNLFFFILKVPVSEAFKRNARRFVCSFCAAPLLTAYYPSKKPKHCPICAGPLYRRIDDKPEKFKIRLEEYQTRTKPIFDFVKKRGYKVEKVNGQGAPYKIAKSIYKILKKRLPVQLGMKNDYPQNKRRN